MEGTISFSLPGLCLQWVFHGCQRHPLPETGQGRVVPQTLRHPPKCLQHDGRRRLDGDGVEEQRIALSHGTGPEYFSQDWQIWQKPNRPGMSGDALYLDFRRYVNGFGFAKPAPGVSYEQMKEAPESGTSAKASRLKRACSSTVESMEMSTARVSATARFLSKPLQRRLRKMFGSLTDRDVTGTNDNVGRNPQRDHAGGVLLLRIAANGISEQFGTEAASTGEDVSSGGPSKQRFSG